MILLLAEPNQRADGLAVNRAVAIDVDSSQTKRFPGTRATNRRRTSEQLLPQSPHRAARLGSSLAETVHGTLSSIPASIIHRVAVYAKRKMENMALPKAKNISPAACGGRSWTAGSPLEKRSVGVSKAFRRAPRSGNGSESTPFIGFLRRRCAGERPACSQDNFLNGLPAAWSARARSAVRGTLWAGLGFAHGQRSASRYACRSGWANAPTPRTSPACPRAPWPGG